jgi:signal transduction histidine kinase/CheY-like chemotaxis protein
MAKHERSELSPEAQRLLEFVKYNEPAGPIGCVLIGLVWYTAGDPLVSLLFAAICVNWAVVVHARRLLYRDAVAPAVWSIATGMWAISLGIWFTVPDIYGLAVIIMTMPIVLAAAYLRRRYVVPIGGISVAVALAGGLYFAFEPWQPAQGVRDWAIKSIIAVFVPALTASSAFAVWHSTSRLLATLHEMRVANRALAESESVLERKVEERTADLTRSQRELALARDEALAANRTKSTFLANMSHELRTPLNAIIGYSEMLQEEARDAGHDGYVPDLERILASGKHLLGLINDVLDLSKIEAVKVELFAESFDVAELVRGVAATIQPLIEKNGNRLELDDLAAAGSMYSDATRLRQILFNLLSNAAKFTRQGTIRVSVTRESRTGGDRLCFAVRDTGIGMTPEQQSRLFQAFSQGDASTTRDYGGTGLGLAITKRFCEMLGGDVELTSEPGRGSEFRVQLPSELPAPSAEQSVAVEAPGAEPVDPAAGLARVLVIDDDESARDLLRRFLEQQGYAVATAAGGAAGLALARQLRPDVITLDVLMPEVDGWTVLSTLKADVELADIPVILLTMVEEQNLGYTLGASEYLNKPIDRERLAALLRRFVSPESRAPVLVVDDHLETRQLLRRAIEKDGFRVVEATNGREALVRVEAEMPTLILLDLMMPVMDGFEFLTQLREREVWRSIPVAVVTAKDLTAEERERLAGAAEKVLKKGAYSRQELLAEVRRLVAAHTERDAQT